MARTGFKPWPSNSQPFSYLHHQRPLRFKKTTIMCKFLKYFKLQNMHSGEASLASTNHRDPMSCYLSPGSHKIALVSCRKCWWDKSVLFSSPEPKARVSYCHSAPSVVRPSVRLSVRRPSVRKLFTFSTSSPELLDGFWWNLVCMKYSWSLTSVVVFRPDPPRGGSRAVKK